MEWSPHFFFIGESFEFLLGPSLFLYTKSLTEKDFRIKKTHLWHLTPFIISAVFLSFKFHFLDTNTKLELLNAHVFTLYEYLVHVFGIYFQFLSYSIATIILLVRYNNRLKEYYSAIEKINLTWLVYIVSIFILLWVSGLIHFILMIFGVYFSYPDSAGVVTLFLFSNIILFRGLKYPEIFSGIKVKTENGKSILKDEDIQQYSQKLKLVMNNDKPYLEPSISLNDLAQKLSISPRYLSYVINKSYHQNFYDYINKYRIEESKRLLSHPENNSKTVLEILYDVGFNSKSVFNSAFKRYVGMTPSQYKRQTIN
ncbi:helix-turn-helix domain-containing protein [Bacteroidota bacterium]